ncbi:MAG TPA: sigma-54 dependent transcriptional regulator [Vicinamibacteria bacterium]|nr:sigma-54 dependent transcriptional regulator [Vicinamibacteria bacterium]
MNEPTGSQVLVVDDDASMQRMLRQRLEREGYAVQTAPNGEEGLDLIRKEVFNLIITDLRMPKLRGDELVRAVSQFNPNIPIIVMTAYGEVNEAVELMQDGIYHYVTKPFDVEDLVLKVKRALDKQITTSEARQVRNKIMSRRKSDYIVGSCPKIEELLTQISIVAQNDVPVIIYGESGTGKELVARAIHYTGKRADRPFVVENCGAIPENLIENELFGHMKGAYTDARTDQKGLFEEAHGGTLFLDEIGELPTTTQVKFLRVLQDGEFKRIGSTRPIRVDVRVIAATNKDLIQAIADKSFREDLFYRLNVIPVHIPPLRERKEDIPLLINHFLTEFNKELGKVVEGFSPAAIQKMMTYQWPGNIRELKNKVKQAMVLTRNNVITAEDLFFHVPVSSNKFQSFKEAKREFEKEYISQVLRICQGNISQAARLAKKDRKDFYDVMKKYGIQPEAFRKQQAS